MAVSLLDIESFEESKDGKITIVYFVPDDKGDMVKKNEVYDCFETEELVRTFKNISTNMKLKEKQKLKKQQSLQRSSEGNSG